MFTIILPNIDFSTVYSLVEKFSQIRKQVSSLGALNALKVLFVFSALVAVPWAMFHVMIDPFMVGYLLNRLNHILKIDDAKSYKIFVLKTIFTFSLITACAELARSIITGLLTSIPHLSYTALFVIEHTYFLGFYLFAIAAVNQLGFKSLWQTDENKTDFRWGEFFKGMRQNLLSKFFFFGVITLILGGSHVFYPGIVVGQLSTYLWHVCAVCILTPMQATAEEIYYRRLILTDVKEILFWLNNQLGVECPESWLTNLNHVYNGFVFGLAHMVTGIHQYCSSVWHYLAPLIAGGVFYAQVADDQKGIEQVSGMHAAHNMLIYTVSNAYLGPYRVGAAASEHFVVGMITSFQYLCDVAAYQLSKSVEQDPPENSETPRLG